MEFSAYPIVGERDIVEEDLESLFKPAPLKLLKSSFEKSSFDFSSILAPSSKEESEHKM